MIHKEGRRKVYTAGNAGKGLEMEMDSEERERERERELEREREKGEEELHRNFSNFSLLPFLNFSSSFSPFLTCYIFLFPYVHNIPAAASHSKTVSP